MKKILGARFFKVFFWGVAFALLIYLNPKHFFSPFGDFLGGMLVPFQKVTYAISMTGKSISDFFVSVGSIKTENEKLFEENLALKAQNAKLGYLENENADLRQQLDLLPRDKYNLIGALIVAQDQGFSGGWIEIDKGEKDGIKDGMPVIISKGVLVGSVFETDYSTSRVYLLTSPNSAVNVISSETGAKGVIKGEFGLGIVMDMIMQTDQISTGNNVITSGLGGAFPKGLFVGVVQDVRFSDDHLYQQATVISPVQLSKLGAVFVIGSSK